MAVDFVNSFKDFKGKRATTESSEIEKVKDDCRGKMTYFADR